MNGAHDLGGKFGLGAIDPETDEPVFHADWEKRVFALTLATGMLGQWNIDESRFARERQHPVTYLNNSYYENWLAGLETLLAEKQLLGSSAAGSEKNAALRVPEVEDARKILFSGGPTEMEEGSMARFSVGDRVRVLRIAGQWHTRAPGYVQGAEGSIAAHYGSHVYPDDHARGSRRGEHLYSVSFSGESLFGPDAQSDEVLVDLWEPYLEHLAP